MLALRLGGRHQNWTGLVCAGLTALSLQGCGGGKASTYRCDGCNVVLILIDTLRSDHLPCYGYARNTAPAVCGLAAQSLLFEDVTATSSWTKPSTASLLSGLYARSHRALSGSERLPDDVSILPEILKARGYATHAFSGNGSVGPDWNFDQGYDTFVQFPDPIDHILSDDVNAKVLPFVEGLEAEPFFLFVHYVDPHDPYTPPVASRKFSRGHPKPSRKGFETFVAGYRGGAKRLAWEIDYYDDEILHNDRSVAALLAALERRGVMDRTVVVVTSDHGEEFFEHGAFTHRKQLFEESLRVPLLIRIPGLDAGVRVSHSVSLVDVLPTLADVIGVELPEPVDGTSWFHLDGHPSAIYAEHRDFGSELVSLRTGGRKVIYASQPREAVAFFDLERDPGEREPAAEDAALLAQLRDWIGAGRRAAVDAPLTPSQQETLEKLGYVEP